MSGWPARTLGALLTLAGVAPVVHGAAPADVRFAPEDTVVVVGNTFAERLAQSGALTAMIHAVHPDARLVVRSLPWSADEVGLRPREHSVPSMESHLDRLQADVVLLCYGMSESFAGAAGVEAFEQDLEDLLDTVGAGADGRERTLILVTPIAHEDLGAPWVTGAALAQRNRDLALYADSIASIGAERGHRVVDLFTPTSAPVAGTGPLTDNGIHPSADGSVTLAAEIARQLGWIPQDVPSAPAEDADAVVTARAWAADLHFVERLHDRPTNTEYVWGRRHAPFGEVNFPPEMEQLRRMMDARDARLWAMEKPAPSAFAVTPAAAVPAWEALPLRPGLPEDDWSPAPVEAKGTETSLGSLDIGDPESFIEQFELPEGYVIECFASEETIPLLQNPLAMTFDERGRLWVLCSPTYPHLMPGDDPACRLIVLEDTNGDGAADSASTFADRLMLPTGFVVDVDAVYLGQAPDLIRLRDTTGDGVADRREIVASGFGMPDSHHQISAFEWEPNGAFLMHEGVFTKSNVETPWGTRRTRDAATWRVDPRTGQIEVLSHSSFSNPWGHAFDDYGQSVLADASGGDNMRFSHVIAPYEYPRKPRRPGPFLNRGRPTAGCELLSSRHFPDEVQDTFLVNQCIGFHGTRWDRVLPEGSGWRAERMPKDLITATDTNFRPVAMEIGPDGALYVGDWTNPIIGHMQYSVRDERRDHTHGRIWRVRHAERPLLTPPEIADASLPELLALLGLPERNTRQHARRRLQRAATADVVPALESWLDGIDPADPLRDRFLLEALWIRQAHGLVDLDHVGRMLALGEPRARAAAVRVLRHWLQAGDAEPSAVAPLLDRAVRDPDQRVRLEAVVAAGFLPDETGIAIAGLAVEQPMDDAFSLVLDEVLAHLDRRGVSTSDVVRRLRLQRMEAEALLEEPLDELVAAAWVTRADLPTARRRMALEHLAGVAPDDQVAWLTAALRGARTPSAVDALALLLLAHTDDTLARAAPELSTLVEDESVTTDARSVALATRLRGEGGGAMDTAPPPLVVQALGHLDPESTDGDALDRLESLLDEDSVEPTAVIEQLVRHDADRVGRFSWLRARVDAVETVGLDRWTDDHELAMAALRGMHEVPRDAWPAGYEAYRLPEVADDVLERGRAIYMDAETGCVRCHGVDGRGVEGFPPLDRSPWLLGDPERAAAIVVHGLFGPVHMPDGRTFQSAMAPLGETLSDEEIAATLTYTRRAWGNFGAPVEPRHVADARAVTPTSGSMWASNALVRRYPTSRDGVLRPIAGPAPPGAAARTLVIFATIGMLVVPVLVVVAVIAVLIRTGRLGAPQG